MPKEVNGHATASFDRNITLLAEAKAVNAFFATFAWEDVFVMSRNGTHTLPRLVGVRVIYPVPEDSDTWGYAKYRGAKAAKMILWKIVRRVGWKLLF